jgi:hypothetical protein
MTCTYFDASATIIIEKYQVDYLPLTQPILQFQNRILSIRKPERNRHKRDQIRFFLSNQSLKLEV